MRILYCNKYNFRFSGTEAYLFDTMELMRDRGHQVALFSMADPRGQSTPYDSQLAPQVDFKEDRGLLAKSRLAVHAIYSVHARKKIREMIEAFRPEVAHVRNIYHHLSPSILCELKARGVPVLYHLNDLKLLCPAYNMVSSGGVACDNACRGGRFWHVIANGCYSGGRACAAVLAAEAYFHRWLRTYERCVDLLLAPSEFVKHMLVANGWGESQVRVLRHFQQLPQNPALHPGPDAPILYFGRLSAEKGVADLIAAVSEIPQIQLIIAGEGPQRSELEKKTSALGLANVQFLGQVSESILGELIARSQFTVFPSRAYETLGKSILESFAQSRAVVASDLGSRRELLCDGKTGLLYPSGNVAELSATIKFLCEQQQLCVSMGQAGRELVQQRHYPEHHALELEKTYRELIERRKHVGGLRLVSAQIAPQRGPTEIQPLRIAYIGGRGVIGKYSGIETFYEEAGKRLAAMGHEVTIYCRTYFTPSTTAWNGIHIVRLPTIWTKHLDTLVHTLLSTVHACFSHYDIVHFHTLGPALFVFLPRIFGKKTMVTVQGLDWKRRKWGWFARSVLKAGEWAAATMPNKTIVVSHTLQNHFRARYSVDCTYVPNGTELRDRSACPSLEQFGLSARQYVLFLGRFSPEKNCDLLIEAFEKTQTSMKLVLAGGSSHTDGYVLALRKHEGNRIKILEWLSGETLQAVLTNAALFVLPSEMEGLSLALLEGMGAGLCVLASDTPENREVVGDCGFTFRAGDIDDLQHMLALLLHDSALRDIMGRKARARVEANYLWDDIATQIEATYLDVVGRRKTLVPQEVASYEKVA